MTPAYIHLVTNHIPLFAMLFGTGMLILGMAKGSDIYKKLALWFFVIGGLASIPVYFTGEPAEEVVKRQVGVSGPVMHEHEEAAEFAFAATLGVGAMAALLLVWWHRKKTLPKKAWIVMLVVSLWALSTLARTAQLGGRIRRPELRAEP